MGKERYRYLLKDNDIARWKHSVDAGSTITGDVYLRRLGSFCAETGKTPKELIKMKDKALVDLIDDYVINREKKGNAGSYIANTIKAVKSWLLFNGIKLQRQIKVRDVEKTPTLAEERIPTQEELKKIFNAGDSRERIACAFVAFSGVRIGVLGNYKGTDGLKIKDIPDLIVERETVSFKKIPAQIIVREELSKSGNKYFTFMGKECCMYLENYLIERIRSGEELTPESPVITASKKALRKGNITTVNIGDLMRNAIRNAGFNWRPYVLRAYFDSRLLMAQDSRLITRDYRTFFMGHVGDIEHRYTLNKGRLSEDLIEAMRSAYEKSTKYLETDHKGLSEEEVEDKFRKQLLLMAGFTEDEIKEKNMLTMTAEEITKLAREKLFGAISRVNIQEQIKKDREELTKTHKQKVVPINMVEEYINEGFVVKMALGNDKAIVELP
ncbi:site-specific integrase [Caldiplasma sukawensis]